MTTYQSAGVDVAAGESFAKWIGEQAPEAVGFAGLYPFGDHYLVGCTDGVGTKLKVAFALDQHESVGIDLVAMCVNDLITTGAKPLFFLDYFAMGQLNQTQAKAVLSGVMAGCKEAGLTLLGGESAEMPGFYPKGEYDLAGFSVGAVEQKKLIDGGTIQEGDLLIGLPSSGFHSNGFSLIRSIYNQAGRDYTPELLTPTKIYVHELAEREFKGAAHITGGGLHHNISRILPNGLQPRINRSAWEVPASFRELQELGAVAEEEMFATFNMGIGMVLVVDREWQGEERVIGEVVA